MATIPASIEYIPRGILCPEADEDSAFKALDGINDVMPFLVVIHDQLMFTREMHVEHREYGAADDTERAARHILAAMEALTPGTLRKILAKVADDARRIEEARIARMMHL